MLSCMIRRLVCRLVGHREHAATVYLPDILTSFTFCQRCGEPGWIERH
jgi:hypothetical protein